MTPEELAEVEERCRKATAGPWEAERAVDRAGFEQNDLWIIMRGQPCAYRFDRTEDAEFCAHARADVPALVAEVRRLREDRDEGWNKFAKASDDNARLAVTLGTWVERAEKAEAEAAEVQMLRVENKRLRRTSLPHMCRDGHEEIRHAGEDELCPVCRAKNEAERAREERDEACAEVEAVSGYYCPQFVNQLKADIARLEHERDEAVANSMKPEARREYAAMILRDYRGVEDPCPVCDGWGIRIYPSTARWRGGVGGQAITPGVCDRCWGSGDGFKPWVSMREVEATRARVERLEAEVARLREALDAAQRIVKRKADREAGREEGDHVG